MVVPGRIEALTLLVEPLRVEVGVQDFLFAVQRAGQVTAIRAEDRGAAAAEDVHAGQLVAERKVFGIRACPLEMRRADDERARLPCDVDKRRLPSVAVVGGRGDVDLDSRLVQREAGKRHVVLPADQPADPPDRRRERAQAAAVSLAPDEPLVVRRDELAVVQRKPAVRPVVQKRVVERSRPLRVALVHAGDEPNLVLACNRAEAIRVRARHLDRLAGELRERALRARVGPPREELRPRGARIRRHERLGEDDELGTAGLRLGG